VQAAAPTTAASAAAPAAPTAEQEVARQNALKLQLERQGLDHSRPIQPRFGDLTQPQVAVGLQRALNKDLRVAAVKKLSDAGVKVNPNASLRALQGIAKNLGIDLGNAPSKQPSKAELNAAAAAQSVSSVVQDIAVNSKTPGEAKTKLGIVSKGLQSQANTLLKASPNLGVTVKSAVTPKQARQAILAFINGDIGTAENALGLSRQALGEGVASVAKATGGLLVAHEDGSVNFIPTSGGGAGTKQEISAVKHNMSTVIALAASMDSAAGRKEADTSTPVKQYLHDHVGVSETIAGIMSSLNLTGRDNVKSAYAATFIGLHSEVLAKLAADEANPTIDTINQAISEVLTDKALSIAAARAGVPKRQAIVQLDNLKSNNRAAYNEIIKSVMLPMRTENKTPKQISEGAKFSQIASQIFGGR